MIAATSTLDNPDPTPRTVRAGVPGSPAVLVLVLLLAVAAVLPAVASWALTSSTPRDERVARPVRLIWPLRPTAALLGRLVRPARHT